MPAGAAPATRRPHRRRTAESTAQANDPRVVRKENPDAAATIAVRSSTSAVASLSRDSPSSTVTTRRGTPSRRTMDVATASVGLRIAPSATASGKPRPGMAQKKNSPSTTALTITRSTDRPPIAARSRRNSIAGAETAAENSSGGNTPTRINSGGTDTAATPGIRLTPTPTATRISGPAMPVRLRQRAREHDHEHGDDDEDEDLYRHPDSSRSEPTTHPARSATPAPMSLKPRMTNSTAMMTA